MEGSEAKYIKTGLISGSAEGNSDRKEKELRHKVIILIFFLLLISLWSQGVLAAANEYFDISEPWVYTLVLQVEIKNPSSQSIRNVNITFPLMDQNQPEYQKFLGEEFNPWPNKIITSKAGTRQGVFYIPLIRPGEKVVIKQKYAVKNYAIDYQIEPSQVISDYENGPDLVKYLQPEMRIQSDNPAIINYAREVAKNETNPYILAQKLFVDINLFMTYREGVNANKGALNALKSGEGVCEDYTDLFVASARALGIPARWLSGYLYLPKEHNVSPYIRGDGNLDISLMRHTWPEFYLSRIGWVPLDPTFTYMIKSGKSREKAIDWSKFAQIESASRHIFFSYGSHEDGYIECKYTGQEPKVEFSEYLEFGKNIFPFRDAVNHWAKDSIMFLTDFTPPIIGGYGNGIFGPDDHLTRAQLVAMLNRILSLDYNVQKPQFSDVKPGYWAYADIAAAKGAGIVGGFPDGTFRPDQEVSRAEVAVILDRAFNLPYPAAGVSFKDLGKAGYAWADASIITLAGNGIAAGYSGGLYKPEQPVSRAEVAVFLSRILDGTFRLKIN